MMAMNLRAYRFPQEAVKSKTGRGGKTVYFVDIRDIAMVLDALAPGWNSRITRLDKFGDQFVAVCELTVDGVAREDVGEGDDPFDAGNQAFRRAACAHGLGAYLWPGSMDEVAEIAHMLPLPDIETRFKSGDDAMQWGSDTGVFNSKQHAENAYCLVKRTVVGLLNGHGLPHNKIAGYVFDAWDREVEHRIIAANEKAAARVADNGA